MRGLTAPDPVAGMRDGGETGDQSPVAVEERPDRRSGRPGGDLPSGSG